ncbi:hypothetical protein [Neorhizobium sp. JUb45]|nr:hypothetical protein [Neorhizobium sp. JUb45]TCQ97982.1 hypothetical protein EDF70_11248 [Neorhizobium sp. JUb45]
MTISLETLIEELLADLSNTWDPAEPRLLIAELDRHGRASSPYFRPVRPT